MEAKPRARAPRKEIFGWAMFDFANSAYVTVIITVVFAEIFPRLIVGQPVSADGQLQYRMGNLLWSIALAVSYGLVVLTAPLFGAIMDHSAAKKRFLFASYLVTVLATACLFFVRPGGYVLGMILIILSNFGFATGENFVSSFLPNLGPPEDLGRISGYAWGLGYFGGLAAVILVNLLGSTGHWHQELVLVGPLTALFFLLAAVPTFLWVKERGRRKQKPAGLSYLRIGLSRLQHTLREVREFRDLGIYLLAVLFSMAGLSIVIAFTFIYGNQVIKWDGSTRIIMFVLTQLTAAGGALLFGWLQDRIGSLKTFNITLVLWIVCTALIWGAREVTVWVNGALGTELSTQHFFLVLGALAGLGLGATQSSSRAIVGLFSPESRAGEFFGFWGLAGKLAAIMGLLSLGFLQNWVGLQSAILLCSLFFIAALVTTFFVNESRGRQAAIRYEGK